MTKQRVPGNREVVLVAHEPPNTEHLGIRLVAAGLKEAGFRPRVLPVGSPANVATVVGETLATQPFLVGVSICDPLAAPLLLAFARLLRQRGFAGHITAGGPLATLQRKQLLASHPAIDSVIRHAGEAAIVELARALGEAGSLDRVPGLTTRLSDGSGNPQAFTPSQLWPLRAEQPPTLIGIAKADVAASRGCAGRCAYCGVAALERDLENERSLLGLPASHPRGSIHRPIDDLADEVAALYHERRVRIVQLVDDNVLGADARGARAWLGDLEAALRRRRVGPMAWRLMAEPSAVSDEVADALARLGAISVLVGIESLTPQGKAALGRSGGREADLAVLHRLAARGISPLLNLLALRPDGTLAETRTELAGLAELDDFIWEVVPLTVWPGTALAEQLAAKGQLAGQGAGMAWRPAEPEAERFLFALNRLRMGGLAWVARLPCPVDVLFALRVAHRLGIPGSGRDQVDRAQAVLAQAQRVRQRILAQALTLATSPLSARELGQAVEALQQQSAQQLAPFDERFARMLDEVSWPDTSPRPARRLASPWLAHGLMMAMAAGCGASTGHDAGFPVGEASVRPEAPVIRLDVPVADVPVAGPETQPVDARPLPHETCVADGGQSASLDGSCNIESLDRAVSRATTLSCHADGTERDIFYAVVIDCDGRAIELLGLPDQTPLALGQRATGLARFIGQRPLALLRRPVGAVLVHDLPVSAVVAQTHDGRC